MNLQLTDEQSMIQAMAREFAQAHVAPIAAEIDRDARFPHETVKRMGELGLMGIAVPERWGGAGADVGVVRGRAGGDQPGLRLPRGRHVGQQLALRRSGAAVRDRRSSGRAS